MIRPVQRMKHQVENFAEIFGSGSKQRTYRPEDEIKSFKRESQARRLWPKSSATFLPNETTSHVHEFFRLVLALYENFSELSNFEYRTYFYNFLSKRNLSLITEKKSYCRYTKVIFCVWYLFLFWRFTYDLWYLLSFFLPSDQHFSPLVFSRQIVTTLFTVFVTPDKNTESHFSRK